MLVCAEQEPKSAKRNTLYAVVGKGTVTTNVQIVGCQRVYRGRVMCQLDRLGASASLPSSVIKEGEAKREKVREKGDASRRNRAAQGDAS